MKRMEEERQMTARNRIRGTETLIWRGKKRYSEGHHCCEGCQLVILEDSSFLVR